MGFILNKKIQLKNKCATKPRKQIVLNSDDATIMG